MWLQTGNEKQWLAIEHRRIAAQARATGGIAPAAVAAAIRTGRILQAVLEPPRTGSAVARFGPPGTAW